MFFIGSYPPAEGSEHINHDELSVTDAAHTNVSYSEVANPIIENTPAKSSVSLTNSMKSNSYRYKDKQYYSGVVSPMHDSSPLSPQSVSSSIATIETLNSNSLQYRMDQPNNPAESPRSLTSIPFEPL